MRLTQGPGTFLPAASCAQAAHSQQVSSCTAERHELLGFPGFKKIHDLDKGRLAHIFAGTVQR